MTAAATQLARPYAPKFELEKLVWREIGPADDPRAQLKSTLQIGDAYLHVNAIAVKWAGTRGRRMQEADAPDDHTRTFLEDLACTFGATGPFETVRITGRRYALFFSPFCD